MRRGREGRDWEGRRGGKGWGGEGMGKERWGGEGEEWKGEGKGKGKGREREEGREGRGKVREGKREGRRSVPANKNLRLHPGHSTEITARNLVLHVHFLFARIFDSSSESEVGDLELHGFVQQHVTELEVAVNHSLRVNVAKSRHQAAHVVANLGVCQSCAVLDHVNQRLHTHQSVNSFLMAHH